VDGDTRFDRVRALPGRANDRARALVDSAIDRVFDQPFDVRTADELERLVAEGPIGSGPGAAATSLGAFVAAAMPLAQRALRIASKSSKVATKLPVPSSKVVRVGMASLPVALRLGTTTRRGVRELQLLASYVINRLRAAGVEPDRGLVQALTLSLYADPARPPALDTTGSRWTGAITRQWVLRSLSGEGETAVRARARREAEALDRLDLRALAVAWARKNGAIDI
jgi:hypothetical protein